VFFAGRRIAQRTSSGTVYFYYADTLGTIHTITNGTGTACYDATFTPYGDEMLNPNISQTCSSNYKFTGYEYDSETGLYYAKARYYNPRLGRFMTPDPLGGQIGDPQSVNRYVYVLNNPLSLIDPLGLADCPPNTEDTCVSVWAYPPNGTGGGGGGILGGGMGGGGGNGGVVCSFAAAISIQGHAYLTKSCGNTQGGGGGGGRGSGYTLGIRAPGQSYKQCLEANSRNYSLGGVADLTGLTGGTNLGSSFGGQLLAGNTFTSLLFGSPSESATAAATSSTDLVKAGIGTVTTFGRRSSDIIALNLAGKGGLPQALSSSSSGLSSLLGGVSKIFNLGLDASLKAAIDAGLALAEVGNCIAHR
jgi:RHS repeat-associated protein